MQEVFFGAFLFEQKGIKVYEILEYIFPSNFLDCINEYIQHENDNELEDVYKVSIILLNELNVILKLIILPYIYNM